MHSKAKFYGGFLDRCIVGRSYSGNDRKSFAAGFKYIKIWLEM